MDRKLRSTSRYFIYSQEPRRMKTLKTLAVAAAIVTLTGAAQAALVSLGDGTVKDTNTNLIWLQNWNVNGSMNASTQNAWAEGLDFAGSDAWDLPEISEYRALVTAYGDLRQLDVFTNVQTGGYWSDTAFSPTNNYWHSTADSILRHTGTQNLRFAVAVRAADATAAVPEPQSLALALLALGAAVVARRKRPGTPVQAPR